MSRPIITVEGLGKQYAIGTKPSSYQTLREALMEGLKAPVRRLRAMRGHAAEENLIWALKDVSFEVQEGEVLGIIGRNGAGKSTLLKILSRITDPTEGWAEIRGRVASLLEVGTGFHLELTGRENIYLNGAILGMRKAEIARKFDEIVDFAEIEQFIDTPVKHYSSGMYVRLAFAVAAHLEPEILIVDEVLAVGDIAFQKKCLGKMEDISLRSGRTVLFVSHNIAAIAQLCSTVILLSNGRLSQFCDSSMAMDHYFTQGSSNIGSRHWPSGIGDDISLVAMKLTNGSGHIKSAFSPSEDIIVSITYVVNKPTEGARIGFRLSTIDGVVVFTSEDTDTAAIHGSKHRGTYMATATIPKFLLNEGEFQISVGCHQPLVRVIFLEHDVLRLTINNISAVGGYVDDRRKGIIRPALTWSVIALS